MTIVNDHPEETLDAILKSDPKLSSKEVVVDVAKYGQPASDDSVDKTKAALEENGHKVTVLASKEEAFEFLKKLIPPKASVNNGHSTTLEEIGFISYLKTATEWKNVHAEILAEKDYVKQSELRRTIGYTVDYYLSSASAITETGDIVGADASGTRISAWSYTAANLIIISGTNKIVKDLSAARERLDKYAFALESARAQMVYKAPSQISNYIVIHKGNPWNPNRVHVVLIKEALGY